MDIGQLVLEYLRVLLSWPAATLAIVIVVSCLFRPELRKLIGGIKSVKVGGAEVAIGQTASSIAIASEAAPGDQTSKDAASGPQALSNAPENTEVASLRAQAASERHRAYIWEYSYLDLFLAPITQWTLDWIANFGNPVTLAGYDAQLGTVPVEQRRIVLDVLRAHHLVMDVGPGIVVSPKGNEYRQWRDAGLRTRRPAPNSTLPPDAPAK